MSNTVKQSENTVEDKARAALQLLDEAWAYYTPEPLPVHAESDAVSELFQYHAAA